MGTLYVSVVTLSPLRISQDGVGFGYLDETFGCIRVVGIMIWVMGFGEIIELPA